MSGNRGAQLCGAQLDFESTNGSNILFFDMSINSRSWNGGLVEHSQGWSSPFSDPSNDERGQSSNVKNIPRGDHNEETSEEASFDSILSSYTKHISANPPMNPVGTPELSNMLAQVYGPKVSDSEILLTCIASAG